MEEKRSAVFTIILLSAILLALTGADLIQGDRLYSETENKVLASRPKYSAESLLSGRYTREYENYLTEQFVGRDKWIALKTYMDVSLQKKEINGVYLARDGYLIERHLPGDYSSVQEEKKLLLLEKLVKRWDADVMLVPTADNILTDKLPPFASFYDQEKFLERVKSRVGQEHYLDIYTKLAQHEGEELYYRTDHHWTGLGAYYGYLTWAESGGTSADRWKPEDMETASEDFLGTLHSKVNLEMQGDRILYFPEENGHPESVTYDFGRTADSCYETSYLDKKNKYGFFLDDNHAFVEIDTGYRSKKSLFVIKDSYANCLIPLLMPYYEKIYVMDLRYFNGRLFGFMEEYEKLGDMDVLVLYNCIHFLEEFQYLE